MANAWIEAHETVSTDNGPDEWNLCFQKCT